MNPKSTQDGNAPGGALATAPPSVNLDLYLAPGISRVDADRIPTEELGRKLLHAWHGTLADFIRKHWNALESYFDRFDKRRHPDAAPALIEGTKVASKKDAVCKLLGVSYPHYCEVLRETERGPKSVVSEEGKKGLRTGAAKRKGKKAGKGDGKKQVAAKPKTAAPAPSPTFEEIHIREEGAVAPFAPPHEAEDPEVDHSTPERQRALDDLFGEFEDADYNMQLDFLANGIDILLTDGTTQENVETLAHLLKKLAKVYYPVIRAALDEVSPQEAVGEEAAAAGA
jgi:hypothetical protein